MVYYRKRVVRRTVRTVKRRPVRRKRRYYPSKMSLISPPEVKYKIYQTNGSVISSTPTITDNFFYDIAQGGATTQRIGHQIRPISCLFRYFVSHDVGNADCSIIRMMLVIDRHCNGVAFTAADLLDDTTVQDNLVSSYVVPNSARFRVIYDRIINIDDNRPCAYRKFNYRFPANFSVKYDATASAITDLSSNNIALVTISNQAVNVPIIVYSFKVRYTDV